jgi:YHS domain-containing protein/thiol-disulfide isomerase/thioredoxin
MFRLRKKHCAALAGIVITGLLTPICLAAAQTSLPWQTNLESAKQLAAQTNRLVLVHFWSPSCVPCKQVEKNVFSAPQVQQTIEAHFVPVKINADDWPTTTKQYGISALPTDLIITPTGQIVGRMISPQTPDAYLQKLASESSGASAPIAAQPAPSPVAPPASTVYSPAAAGIGATAPAASHWLPQSVAPPANITAAVTPAAPSAAPANVGWGAASAAKPNNAAPAISAYSDNRYSEYFQKYAPAASVSAPAINAAPGMNAAQNVAAAAPPISGTATAYTPTSYAGGGYAPPTVTTQQPVYTPPAAAMTPAAASSGYGTPAYGSPAYTPPSYTPPSSSVTPVAPSISAPSAQLAAQHTTPPAAASPASSMATAASPPLALDGFCPVTLVEQARWQVGDRRWGVIHRGRTYLFTGPEQQKKFLANPDRYSPAISGQDVVLAMDYGQQIDGRRALGLEYQNRMYLFSSDASRQAFVQNPTRYAAEVLQAEAPTGTTLR